MIKEFTGGVVTRSRRERYQRTPWTEDIQIASFDGDDAEEAEKRESEARRPGSEVKVEVPAPANSKSIFLEAARLRNKDSQQFGGVSMPARTAKAVTRAVTATADGKLADVLARLSVLLKGSDLAEAQLLLESLKQQMPPARSTVEAVLETFEGVLDCIDGDTAYVTLTSTTNGDVLYGEYPAASFSAKGIEEEDRFICKTVGMDGATRIEIQAVPDAELTEENIRAIRAKIEKVLPRNDPGVKY
jgi:hypothetical protein